MKKNWIRPTSFALAAALTMTAFPVAAMASTASTPAAGVETEASTAAVELGTAHNALEAGTYSIPATLMNAGNLANKSMAASCIKDETAVLTIQRDGTVNVTVDLQAVNIFGLTAYASDWKIYQGTSASGETKDAEAHTSEDGKVDQITFALPDNRYDGVFVSMYVDAMGASPDAYLKLDYASAVKIKDAEPEPTPEPTPTPEPELSVEPGKDSEVKTIKDGNYYVPVNLWNATADKASMGDAAFKKKDKALITVKDNKVTRVQIALNPVEVGTVYSAVTAFEAEGVTVSVDKTEKMVTSAGNTIDAIRLVSFELPEGAQPLKGDVTYLNVAFKVADTPMGNSTMNARLKFNWASMTETGDASIVTSETKTESKTSAVAAVDKETGIKIEAEEGVLPEGTEAKITGYTSDSAEYKKAASIIGDGILGMVLYDISLIDPSGTEVEPASGKTVKTSLPIPDALKGKTLVLYRINDDGTKTRIKGEIKDGYFVAALGHFSQYALVAVSDSVTVTENKYNETNTTNTSAVTNTAPSTGGANKEASVSPVQTGDTAQPAGWLALMAGSLAAAGAAFFTGKRKKEQGE